MPIHEFRHPDGRVVERLFLHGEKVPDGIYIEDQEQPAPEEGAMSTWSPRIVSRPVVKFATPMSGGTTGRDMVHVDDGSIYEPGRDKDVQRVNEYKEANETKARHDLIKESLADYDV
jgi:hypothetical protein